MREKHDLFQSLSKSKFRSKFKLAESEREYLEKRTMPEILQHARQFIADRLAPAQPRNDGKQTPFRGHPVFVAQHATATCCRSCLQKWHYIERGKELTESEIAYVVDVIADWIQLDKK